MAQWRNVGLRGRPQLLQQAWLVPEFAVGRESLMGLRVRKLVEGSFWHQLGLAEGDLLERLNGDRIDSMDQWQALVRAAEMDKEISVAIRRDGRSLRFHTKTVPPRGLDKPV
jgi:type II secretory pathway component PulC